MLRSMYSGIGGMRNFQTKLDVIGNNIANVNTFGFKKGRVTFKDLVSQQLAGASTATANRGGTNPQQIGLGASLGSIDTIHTQGSLQTTNRDLDIGISGDGFFIVNDGDMSYYTRAGNFYLDQYGNLTNSDGLFVQGYGVDADGNIDITGGIGRLEISAGQLMAPQATTEAIFRGNLSADYAEVTADDSILFGLPDAPDLTNPLTDTRIKNMLTTTVDGVTKSNGIRVPFPAIDSLGRQHDLELVFQKRSDSSWEVGYINKTDSLTDEDEVIYEFGKLGTVYFDKDGIVYSVTDEEYDDEFLTPDANGDLTEPVFNDLLFPVVGSNDAADFTIDINLESLSQFARGSTVDYYSVDGNYDGTLNSYNISSTGQIFGVFSNGEARMLGQIALANFNNAEGLSKAGENLYEVSNNSGDPQVGLAGADGRGTLTGAALEMSNVDLSEEFAEMIVAQRAFQANTRMITTSDEILQELVNLKR